MTVIREELRRFGCPRRAPFDRGSMLLRDERGEGGEVRRSTGGQSEDEEDGTHRFFFWLAACVPELL